MLPLSTEIIVIEYMMFGFMFILLGCYIGRNPHGLTVVDYLAAILCCAIWPLIALWDLYRWLKKK